MTDYIYCELCKAAIICDSCFCDWPDDEQTKKKCFKCNGTGNRSMYATYDEDVLRNCEICLGSGSVTASEYEKHCAEKISKQHENETIAQEFKEKIKSISFSRIKGGAR